MIRALLRHWHGLVVILVLCSTAAIASQVNSQSGPPRSVFVSWPQSLPVPTLELAPHQRRDGSWFLNLGAKGFAFSDICQAVSGPQAIGHAHVFSGERKIAAAYAPRVELGNLAPGTHRFRVVLRAQDNRALIGPDGLLDAEITLVVPDAVG